MVVKETVNKSSSILKACFTAVIIYMALHISVPAYADGGITPDTWNDADGSWATNVEYRYDTDNSELKFRAKSIDSSASLSNMSDFKAVFAEVASQYSCDFKITISGEHGRIGILPSSGTPTCESLFHFAGNNYLVEVDLSGLNTSNVIHMRNMFLNCNNLRSINLNGITTRNVYEMDNMFRGCSSLTSLDLSGFDISSVGDKRGFLSGCTHLQTVVVSDGWVISGQTAGMFSNCTSLVGENGTTYDSSHTDGAYARIDRAPENPGYFWSRMPGTDGSGNDGSERNFDREWIDELLNKIIAIGESKTPSTIKIQDNFALPKEVIETLMKYPNVTLAYMCNYEVNGKMTYHSFSIKGSAAYILRDDIPWYGPKCLVMMYE